MMHWCPQCDDVLLPDGVACKKCQPVSVTVPVAATPDKPRASLTIAQHVAPQNLWHWAVVFDSGHIYAVSDSFGSAYEAAQDASSVGISALLSAIITQAVPE